MINFNHQHSPLVSTRKKPNIMRGPPPPHHHHQQQQQQQPTPPSLTPQPGRKSKPRTYSMHASRTGTATGRQQRNLCCDGKARTILPPPLAPFPLSSFSFSSLQPTPKAVRPPTCSSRPAALHARKAASVAERAGDDAGGASPASLISLSRDAERSQSPARRRADSAAAWHTASGPRPTCRGMRGGIAGGYVRGSANDHCLY